MQLPPRTLANISPPDKTNYAYFENWNERPLAGKSGFDLVNAWRLSEFSLIAYADREFIETQTQSLKASGYLIDLDRSTEAEYLFAGGPSEIVVAFRGTEIDNISGMLLDWARNLKMDFDRDRNGARIHSGFRHALDSIWDGLKMRIQECLRSNQNLRVWLTGHSLGGALANLAAYRAETEKVFEPFAVYTYGSPMVGDVAFGNLYSEHRLQERTFRVRNRNDLITRMPPLSEYIHVGAPHFIDDTGSLQSIEIPREQPLALTATIVAELAGLLPSFLPGERSSRIITGTIADHAPTFYAMQLFNNLQAG